MKGASGQSHLETGQHILTYLNSANLSCESLKRVPLLFSKRRSAHVRENLKRNVALTMSFE